MVTPVALYMPSAQIVQLADPAALHDTPGHVRHLVSEV